MVCVLCVACLQLRESKKDRCVNLELPVGTNKSLDICCSAMRVNCSNLFHLFLHLKEGTSVPWRSEKANWKDEEMHVADILP